MARILTVEEAADKLRVKPYTVREYLKQGKIPGRKLGKSWRIVETELESFLSGEQPRRRRVSARGMLAHIPGFSSEAFMREKHAEIEQEERQFEERRKR